MAAGARVNDRDGKWSTNDGRSGVVASLQNKGKGKDKGDGTEAEGGKMGRGVPAVIDEAERRRLKNKKKREARERKELESKRQKVDGQDDTTVIHASE